MNIRTVSVTDDSRIDFFLAKEGSLRKTFLFKIYSTNICCISIVLDPCLKICIVCHRLILNINFTFRRLKNVEVVRAENYEVEYYIVVVNAFDEMVYKMIVLEPIANITSMIACFCQPLNAVRPNMF